MIDYLSSIYNTREVSLRYTARKEYTDYVADMTREEEMLHHKILNGPMFDQYPKKSMRIIKDITIRTPAEAWINQVKCGYVAMKKLR